MKDINLENIKDILSSNEVRNFLSSKNIEHIDISGSFSRWDQTKNSDIDIIFEIKKWKKFTMFDLIQTKKFLENKLNKKVDLVSRNAIYPHMRESLLSTKVRVL